MREAARLSERSATRAEQDRVVASVHVVPVATSGFTEASTARSFSRCADKSLIPAARVSAQKPTYFKTGKFATQSMSEPPS